MYAVMIVGHHSNGDGGRVASYSVCAVRGGSHGPSYWVDPRRQVNRHRPIQSHGAPSPERSQVGRRSLVSRGPYSCRQKWFGEYQSRIRAEHSAMEHRVPCDCGGYVTVDERAAGTTVECTCGRTVRVPSLRKLAALSGDPTRGLSPELEIETLFSAGKMPFESICVRCGQDTNETVQAKVECERAWIIGGFDWGTLIVTLFLPLTIFRWRARRRLGQDKIYWLPLPVCDECRDHLEKAAELRRCLQEVDVYKRLLEKFPRASVSRAGK
jgi:hypothetical protein